MTDKEYISSIIASEIYLRFVDEQIEETIKTFNRISYEELLQIECNKEQDTSFPKVVKFISFVTNYIANKVTAAFDIVCETNDSELSEIEKSISIVKTLSSGAYKSFTYDEMDNFYDEFKSLSDKVKENIGEAYDKELKEFIRFNFEKRKSYYTSIFGSESKAKRMFGIDE